MLYEESEIDQVLDAIECLFLVVEMMDKANEVWANGIVELCRTGE